MRILLACQRVDEPYGGSLSKEAKDAGTIEIVRSGACAGVVDAASGQRRGRTASPDSIMPSGVALALHIDVAILSLRPRPTPCGRMASWLDVLASAGSPVEAWHLGQLHLLEVGAPSRE